MEAESPKNYIFSQIVPDGAIGLPVNSLESMNEAEENLRNLEFGGELLEETIDWVRNLSLASRKGGQVYGQLRLVKVNERALVIFLRAYLLSQSFVKQNLDFTNLEVVESFEKEGRFLSSSVNTQVNIYADFELNPTDHVIYDTRKCVVQDILEVGEILYVAQTSAITIRAQLTTIFKNWVQSCQWMPVDLDSPK